MNNLSFFFRNFLIWVSFLSTLGALFILFKKLFKKLNKSDLVLISTIWIAALFSRIRYGLFAPWRPEAHHVHLFENLISNLESSFLITEYRYMASGGFFEFIFGIPLHLSSEFSVYTVYYTSLAIHMLMGLLVFMLGYNLFKRKDISYTSLLIFSFTPILINISATSIVFTITSFSLLLLFNFGIYFWEKEKNKPLDSFLLIGLIISVLLGRKEVMTLTVFGTPFILLFLAYLNKDQVVKKIIKNKSLIASSLLFIAACFFFVFEAMVPHLAREVGFRIGNLTQQSQFGVHLNFFRYFSPNELSHTPFFKSFTTPLYFFILLNLFPIVLVIKKRWFLLFLNSLFLGLMLLVANPNLADFRRVMPFLLIYIPQMAYALHFIFDKIKIKPKHALILSALLIVPSTYQNQYFLEAEIGRKIEQDLVIEVFEDYIPENSLIITTHAPHEGHEGNDQLDIERVNDDYKYSQGGMLFNTYLMPKDKNIKLIDKYLQYRPEILDELMEDFDNIFYYKTLYSHHGSWRGCKNDCKNEDNLQPYEATKKFISNHKLTPIRTKVIRNRSYNYGLKDHFIKGANYEIDAKGELKTGLYRVEGLK